ncbi:hypothetical protein [Sphingomonas sp.]|uniref:hypothetical protein n=1 Tax=Sphingomonas sp. TaxID=28214 RepID=UPI003F7FDD7D
MRTQCDVSDLVQKGEVLRVIDDNSSTPGDQVYLTKKGLIDRAEQDEHIDRWHDDGGPAVYRSDELVLNDRFAQVLGD